VARIERQVALLLRRADSNRRSSRLSHTLDRSAYLVLDLLEEVGPENVNAIAEQLRLDGSTVTRQVLALERDGHVVRNRDPRDGRATLVEPTPEGLDALAVTREARATVYGDLLSTWLPEERSIFATLLTRLNDDMDRRTRT
jgi:DNA-binding MarR family transcriptional regulator